MISVTNRNLTVAKNSTLLSRSTYDSSIAFSESNMVLTMPIAIAIHTSTSIANAPVINVSKAEISLVVPNDRSDLSYKQCLRGSDCQ
jgi:hypothetical protein